MSSKPRYTRNSRGLRIGQDHQHARFSEQDIRAVFELYESGFGGYGKVAAKLEMSKSHVRSIILGRSRCQTPDPEK